MTATLKDTTATLEDTSQTFLHEIHVRMGSEISSLTQGCPIAAPQSDL
jgi:hypothetical protein